MKFDAKKVPNGTLLMLGVGYQNEQPGGDLRGRTDPKVYTYALLKAGGLWYMTGAGQAPHAAGWPVVEKWLSRQGRVLLWIKGVHQDDLPTLWTAAEQVEPERPSQDLIAPDQVVIERPDVYPY